MFILTYVKTYALQVVQGRLFGMVQGKANQWIHVLLPVLLAALRALGDAPARSLTALAQRLGVPEAAAATMVTPLPEDSAHLRVLTALSPCPTPSSCRLWPSVRACPGSLFQPGSHGGFLTPPTPWTTA